MSITRIWIHVVLLFIILLFTACGGSSSDEPVPNERPTATVQGKSDVNNATIEVRQFDGSKQELLASGDAGSGGVYSADVKSPDTPVVVCAKNGSYYELASGKNVATEQHELCAVANYRSGASLVVNVNVLTHMAYALATYLINQGESPTVAVDLANRRVRNLTGLSALDTGALRLDDEVNKTSFATDKHLFGVFLAAVSQLTADVSVQNSLDVHAVYHSLAFAEMAFDDLSSDGVLDGVGSQGPISMGSVLIGVEHYRHLLAEAMFTVMSATYNKSGLDGSAVKQVAETLNNSVDNIFGGNSVQPFDQAPAITSLTAFDGYLRGQVDIVFDIRDHYGLDNLTFSYGGLPLSPSINGSIYTLSLNTTGYDDGMHDLTVSASNLFGVQSSFELPLEVFNQPAASVAGRSSMVNADIVITEFGGTSDSLGNETVDRTGDYTIGLLAKDKPLLVCATGGTYVEVASNQNVSAGAMRLCAVENYTAGQALTTNITYYTHLAYGLATYLMEQGMEPADAITQANERISNLLGFPVTQTAPLSMMEAANSTSFATNRHLYGLAIGAVSQLTAEIAADNESVDQDTYNSLLLAENAFNDISADGLLDGIGASGPLSMGTVVLSAETYRHELANAMFTAVNADYNRTSLQGDSIKVMAENLNYSIDDAFAGSEVVAFTQAPTITTAMDLNGRIRGQVDFVFDIDDFYGVSDVSVTLGNFNYNYTQNGGIYTIPVDTAIYGDGFFDLVITAVNLYGVTVEYRKNLNIFNTPPSTVNGVSYDGLILQGDLKVFDFTGGVKGDELASTTTDLNGHYSVEIWNQATPILLEITGGRYIEEASGREVPLQVSEDHMLRAVAVHEPGTTVNIHLTTWTNFAAGLAQYRIATGLDAATAINGANYDVTTILGFDILNTEPLDITSTANAGPVSPELLYGFLAGGLSQWTYNVSKSSEPQTPHLNFNSINFSMLAYDDILYDGRLNGVGAAGALRFAGVDIDANTYRHSIAVGIIQMATNARNRTGLTAMDVLDFAYRLNDYEGSVFGSALTTALDEGGPTVVSFSPPPNEYKRDAFTVNASVMDILGLTQTELLINGTSYGFASDPYSPSFTISPSEMSDCNCDFTLRSTNIIGTVTDTTHKVQIDRERWVYSRYGTLGTDSIVRYSGRPFKYNVGSGAPTNTSLVLPDSLQLIAIHPNNRYAYGTTDHTSDTSFYRYEIDPTNGSLTNPLLTDFAFGTAHVFSQDGVYMFVTQTDNRYAFPENDHRTGNYLMTFKIDPNGVMRLVGDLEIVGHPEQLTVHPTLPVAYVVATQAPGAPLSIYPQVLIYGLNDGVFTPKGGFSTLWARGMGNVVLDRTGRHAYIAGEWNTPQPTHIRQYDVDPNTGFLTERNRYYVPNGGSPVIHSNNQFLYVIGDDPDQPVPYNALYTFSVNESDGSLTPIGNPVPVDIMPSCDLAAGSGTTFGVGSVMLDSNSDMAFFSTGGKYSSACGVMAARVNSVTGAIGQLFVFLKANGNDFLPTRGSSNAW